MLIRQKSTTKETYVEEYATTLPRFMIKCPITMITYDSDRQYKDNRFGLLLQFKSCQIKRDKWK